MFGTQPVPMSSCIGGAAQPAPAPKGISLFYPVLLKTVVPLCGKARGELTLASEMRAIFRRTAPGMALGIARHVSPARKAGNAAHASAS